MAHQREIRKFQLYGVELGQSQSAFVHIERISARASLHNWAIAPHSHPSVFQLLFMQDGEGVLIADGNELLLEGSELVVVPCGSPHGFRFRPKTEGWVLSIADSLLEDDWLATLDLGAIAQGSSPLLLSMRSDPARSEAIARVLDDFARRCQEAPLPITKAVIATIGFLLAVIEEETRSQIAVQGGELSPRIALVRRFNRIVEQHFRDRWTISNYSLALGTSPQTLTRVCRETTGKPPGRIVLDRRLLEARRALSYTDASVSQIADELGFTDPAYFARIFRRHAGQTASTYRLSMTKPLRRSK